MRLQIIAGNLVTLLVVGIVGFFLVKSQLTQGLAAQVDSEVTADQGQVNRLLRLSALEFVEQVEDRAITAPVTSVFGALDEDGRRRRAFDAATGVAAWFQDPQRNHGGRPDIVAITDNAGRVIARDVDINRMFGEQLTTRLPGLRDVLANGTTSHDAFKAEERLVLDVGMAPIRGTDGTVVGALVVGYDISNGVASALAELVQGDVAFVESGKVYSSSLTAPAANALTQVLEGPQQAATRSAQDGGTSTPFLAELSGTSYVGVVSTLPMVSSVKMAYVVLGNRSARLELAKSANVFLYLMLFGLVMMVGYGAFVANSVLDPIEDMEEGVLAVINGQADRRIEVDEEDFGGLAYRINQLIAMATGVSDEGSANGGAWEGEAGGSAAPAPGPVAALAAAAAAAAAPAASGGANDPIDDPALASRLAAESEEAYHARIFQEYVAAKRAAGEDVSAIPQDRFIQRLQGNAKNLAARHGVPQVRFQVQTDGSQVILRPVLIR